MLKPEHVKPLSPLGISIPSWAMGLAPRIQHFREADLGAGTTASIEVLAGVDASMVVAELRNANMLATDTFRDSVAALAWTVLSELSRCSHAKVVRMWNFLPGIHDDISGGRSRYELFNEGRFDGFCRWFGQTECFPDMLPAASAVGHDHDKLVMTAIGTATQGSRIENPRQVPAFMYSKNHGHRPPCFVRAVIAKFTGRPRLIVSGTASILGEESMHQESLELQTAETCRNLVQLAEFASGSHQFSLNSTESARVYYPCESDLPWLQDTFQQKLPPYTDIEFVPAWLCRPELLVEVELTIKPSDPSDLDPMRARDASHPIST